MTWLLLIWLNQITTVVRNIYASISIYMIISSYNKAQPFKFHIGVLSNPRIISEKIENDEMGSTKLFNADECVKSL